LLSFLKELPNIKVKISNSNFLDDEKALHLSKKLEYEHFNDIYKKANKNELFKTRKISYDDFPEPFLNYGKMLEEHSKQKRLVVNYLETKEQRNEMFAEYNQEFFQENTPKNSNKPKP
jgi:hypothetical protein